MACEVDWRGEYMVNWWKMLDPLAPPLHWQRMFSALRGLDVSRLESRLHLWRIADVCQCFSFACLDAPAQSNLSYSKSLTLISQMRSSIDGKLFKIKKKMLSYKNNRLFKKVFSHVGRSSALLPLSFSPVWTCGFTSIHPERIRRKQVVVTCEGPAPPLTVGRLLMDSSTAPRTMRTPHGPNSKFSSVRVIVLPLSLPSFLPSFLPAVLFDGGQMGQMSDDSIRGRKSKTVHTVSADGFCLRAKAFTAAFLAGEQNKKFNTLWV